jgi:hypothetical protein
VIAGIRNHALQVDPEVVPLLRPECEGLEHAGVPALLGCAEGHLGRLGDHDVLGADCQHPLCVAATEGVEGAADELDVLL